HASRIPRILIQREAKANRPRAQVMDTPFFAVCKADSTVRALLGGTLPRIYPFGSAPQSAVKPYAVYQWIGGNPFNTLSDRPKADRAVLQVDVYGSTAKSSTDAAEAIRYAV